MTQLCALAIGATMLCSSDGYFSQYGRIPTDATIEYRRAIGDVPAGRVAGYIAVNSCDLVGRAAWIKVEDSEWMRVGIFDCSGDIETVKWMDENNIVAELGYWLATKLDVVGRGGIRGQLRLHPPTDWRLDDIHLPA